MSYRSKDFWEARYGGEFTVNISGYRRLGPYMNTKLYAIRAEQFIHLLKVMKISPDTRVLEIGCGTGFFTKILKDSFKINHYTGIDIAENSIMKMKDIFPDYRFDVKDISEVDNLGEYDLIIAVDVLFHLINDNNYFNAFQNISNQLSKDGKLLITEGACLNTTQIVSHVKFRSKEEIVRIAYQNSLIFQHSQLMFSIVNPIIPAVFYWYPFFVIQYIVLIGSASLKLNFVADFLLWLESKIAHRFITPNMKWLVFDKGR